jgi:hypothetical protein
MRKHSPPPRSPLSPRRLVWPAFACALLAAASAAAQSSLVWGIEEKASRGCVEDVALAFDAPGVLGGHPRQSLCGSTAVRMYPQPVPTGTLTVSFRNQRGEPRQYAIPLDAVFRREQVRMEQSVLQLVYGQDSLEVWVRPLAPSQGGAVPAGFEPAGTRTPTRIFFGGHEFDAAPLPPGISRSR